jgi:protein kinase-like protein
MALETGTRLGAYEIIATLGAGGMGEVYRARDTKLKRDVALKILPDAFVNDSDRLARFKREAQVLASRTHPNIAAIYGFEESNGIQALVLELVDGPTLADRIARGQLLFEHYPNVLLGSRCRNGRQRTPTQPTRLSPEKPITPLTSARSTLSTRSWRTIRHRVAPSETRRRISLARYAARARKRFATFEQAISSTSAAAPMNDQYIARSCGPFTLSLYVERSGTRSLFVSGYSCASRAGIAAISWRA